MILFHLGVGAALVYVTLGRRRIDYRFILLGAVAPDLIDGVASPFLEQSAGRGAAHSLLAVLVVAAVVVLGLRGERRLALFGLAVGWLTHLVADGMWGSPKTFLWPAFGTAFATTPSEPYSWDVLLAPWDHLGTWAGELLGAGLLAWFWVAFRFSEDGRARRFLRDGYLRA